MGFDGLFHGMDTFTGEFGLEILHGGEEGWKEDGQNDVNEKEMMGSTKSVDK